MTIEQEPKPSISPQEKVRLRQEAYNDHGAGRITDEEFEVKKRLYAPDYYAFLRHIARRKLERERREAQENPSE